MTALTLLTVWLAKLFFSKDYDVALDVLEDYPILGIGLALAIIMPLVPLAIVLAASLFILGVWLF